MEVNASPSIFYQSIQSILKSWTALQLAVSNGFGGPHSREKAQWLVGVIETFFKENDALEAWEVEDFIAEIMSNEFNTVLEDSSLNEVAENICAIYKLWCKRKTQEIREKLQALPCVNLADCIAGSTDIHEEVEVEEDGNLIEDLQNCAVNTRNGCDEHSQSRLGNGPDGGSRSDLANNVPDPDGWIEIKPRRKKR